MEETADLLVENGGEAGSEDEHDAEDLDGVGDLAEDDGLQGEHVGHLEVGHHPRGRGGLDVLVADLSVSLSFIF